MTMTNPNAPFGLENPVEQIIGEFALLDELYREMRTERSAAAKSGHQIVVDKLIWTELTMSTFSSCVDSLGRGKKPDPNWISGLIGEPSICRDADYQRFRNLVDKQYPQSRLYIDQLMHVGERLLSYTLQMSSKAEDGP